MLIRDATAIAAVRRQGCLIQPGEILATIATTPFAHAAWSPTDSESFVTVGGEGSAGYPDTYRYYG
jgi:hypothetical protein